MRIKIHDVKKEGPGGILLVKPGENLGVQVFCSFALVELKAHEALAEPEVGVDERACRKGGGKVSGLGQDLGQGKVFLGENHVIAAPGAMLRRVNRGEERGHRGRGPGRMGITALEKEAFLGEPVEVGTGGAGVSVTAQVVGPQGVNTDDDDMGPGGGACAGRRVAGKAGGRKQEGGKHSPKAGTGKDRPCISPFFRSFQLHLIKTY